MGDFKQQLLNMLNAVNAPMLETSTQERSIPNADGSSIVLQQRKEVERQIKTLAPQLDFTSVDFCPGEQIKLINKLQLLSGVPFNLEKLEYRVIKNTKCLIATAQTNFGTEVTGHDNFPAKIEMTVSNKWTKILHSIVGTENVKYVVAVRCAMENEQTYNDKPYATMKFAFIKTVLKRHSKTCDDEKMSDVDLEAPNLELEEVRKIVRQWAQAESKATFEIHRKNLLWDEDKYLEAVCKAPIGYKRKAIDFSATEVVSKKVVDDNDSD